MRGPYEAFRHDGVAFIIDLESTVIHEPRPCPLDDPTPWEDDELVRVDAVHDFRGDVMSPAVRDERGLEPGVTPQLREPARACSGEVGDFDTTRVVGHVRGDDHDREQQAERVDDPERLATRHPFPTVVAPGRAGDRRRAAHATRIDDPRRRVRVVAFAFAYQGAEPVSDALPRAVA